MVLAVLSVAAACTGGSRAWRFTAVGVAALALPLPFVIPATALAHLLAALVASWGLVRVTDLVREPVARPYLVRQWHVFAAIDTRVVTRTPARFDGRLFGAVLLHAALGLIGLLVAGRAVSLLLRWAGGALFVYGTAGAVADLIRWGYALVGIGVPPIQRQPIASRSIREFWSERWNRIVNRWLRFNIFVPLARRGHPHVGVAAAFIISAVLHAYITVVAIGGAMAAAMGAFFLVQLVMVSIERTFGLGGRLWFLVGLAAPSPLFVEPILRIVLA